MTDTLEDTGFSSGARRPYKRRSAIIPTVYDDMERIILVIVAVPGTAGATRWNTQVGSVNVGVHCSQPIFFNPTTSAAAAGSLRIALHPLCVSRLWEDGDVAGKRCCSSPQRRSTELKAPPDTGGNKPCVPASCFSSCSMRSRCSLRWPKRTLCAPCAAALLVVFPGSKSGN